MPFVFEFFTWWVLALLAAHRVVAPYVDLVFLSFVMLVVGSYVSFVSRHTYVWKAYPGGPSHTLSGWRRFWVVDVSIHAAAMAFAIAFCRYPLSPCSIANAAAIMILYGASHAPEEIYGTTMREISTVFLAACVTYLAVRAAP